MRDQLAKWKDFTSWDQVGIGLSFLCAIHCLVTPFFILAMPFMARYYLAHPYFHIIMAVLIVPVGLFALWSGYRHHRNQKVLLFGLPGLAIVGLIPLFHNLVNPVSEPFVVTFGSILLITAHVINRKSCRCSVHHH